MSNATITGVKCGNHGQERVYHESAAAVRECYTKAAKRPAPGWRQEDHHADEAAWDAEIQRREREKSERVARFKMDRDISLIDVAEGEKQGAVTQDGMYRDPQTGEIFKVQWNRGSGDGRRLYAKRLIMWVMGEKHFRPTKATAEMWEKGRDSVEFAYAPGAMRVIRSDWRMTMEEAKEFGALYGTCVRCGRDLTLEESIERAMGSTCARKANLA